MFKFIKTLFMPKGAKTTASSLALKFGLELRGNPKTQINGIAPIADATAGQLAFYSTERNSAAFKILPISVLQNTKASVILLQPEQVKDAPKDVTLLITDSPRREIVKILGEIYHEKPRRGIHFAAHISKGVFFRKKKSVYIAQFATVERGCVIEADVKIYPSAYIGKNVTLGRGTIVGSGAHIENATIGEQCVINSNAVIGKDGFGYTRQNNKNIFIPHVGRVVIGDHVSVGGNTCIDRGVMTDTIIGKGTKIDNLCQIGHGVIIGRECFLAAGVGLAGGVIIGDFALLGGGVGVGNGVKIGNKAEIGGHSGVMRNVPDGEKHMGYFAMPAMEFMRTQAWIRQKVKK